MTDHRTAQVRDPLAVELLDRIDEVAAVRLCVYWTGRAAELSRARNTEPYDTLDALDDTLARAQQWLDDTASLNDWHTLKQRARDRGTGGALGYWMLCALDGVIGGGGTVVYSTMRCRQEHATWGVEGTWADLLTVAWPDAGPTEVEIGAGIADGWTGDADELRDAANAIAHGGGQ